jgi:hypothetical protein
MPGQKQEIDRAHIYHSEDGTAEFKKVKYKDGSWAIFHFDGNVWKPSRGNRELIPYNLHEFKNFDTAIICEGERDADTVGSLGIGIFATSAPTGKASWPDSITKHFAGFKEVTFLYDVGNDLDVMKHAKKLRAAFPSLKIQIARVPMEEREADITDYLETQTDKPRAFLDIQAHREEIDIEGSMPSDNDDESAITVEELACLAIPEIDWLVKLMIERYGFCLIGAQKGVGKSLFVTQLGLHVASGSPSFLVDSIEIPKPMKVLLIQQEVSQAGMKDRLTKMQAEKLFKLEGRFRQKTTTGRALDLSRQDDHEKLIRLVERYEPDILILDPLYTFWPRELNTSREIGPLMKILSDLKSNYNLGLIVVHHFSNKASADDVQAMNAVGRFMGHSMIANSADNTVALDFLDPRHKKKALPLPYQNYVSVEITTRHGEWPKRLAIERKQGCLLFERSSILEDLGRSIIPGQIEETIRNNGGEMLQKDLIKELSPYAQATTIKRAIAESVRQGRIKKDVMPGKGNPVLLSISR